MSDVVGYAIATRNRASGHLKLDWDGEIHWDHKDAADERDRALAEGEDAVLLHLIQKEEDNV